MGFEFVVSDPKDTSGGEKSEPAKSDATSITPASRQEIVPIEVIEAMRSQGVDVNVLILNLVNRTTTGAEARESAREALELAKEFENFQLEAFKQRASAIIDAKTRDPDEIDKRASNANRRQLKLAIAVLGLGGLAGAGAVIYVGGGVALGLLLAAIGAVAVASLAILASGESLSANDVVKMINAVGRANRREPPPPSSRPPSEPRRARGGKR
jgi:hypothetical protein